jgi:hypothetical protein
MTDLSPERIAELRIFLITLNKEGWAPGRLSWGQDIADLLGVLDDYEKQKGWVEKLQKSHAILEKMWRKAEAELVTTRRTWLDLRKRR